ncbi:MAG: gliding motility-associated C-terminal domain-containing protein, partial [Flavobacteriaceae bacterium]|nr:gliding motility-associated C-terminal domain-containing protein [Flavobacteriaceae bacterium]
TDETSASISGLSAGEYVLIVIDSTGCSLIRTFEIEEPENSLSLTSTNIVHIPCKGAPTGSIEVTVSGGTPVYQYLWKKDNIILTNETSASISGLSAGDYELTVTDSKGCELVETFVIEEPEFGLSLSSINIEDVSCKGESTGSIEVTATGGTPAYQYLWKKGDEILTGETSATISGLSAGIYELTLTDSNGCALIEVFEVKESELYLDVILDSVTPITCESPGLITVIKATGGTVSTDSDYTYTWTNSNGDLVSDQDPDSNPLTLEVTIADTYTLTVSDLKDCTAVIQVEVISNKRFPILSIGQLDCNETTYSVNYISNGAVSSTAGTVDAGNNIITDIPLGINITITSTSTSGCTTSMLVTGLAECPTECETPNLMVGNPKCDGPSTNTYTVKYTETTGAILTITNGTDNGDGTITGTIGADISIKAANDLCVSEINITSPSANECEVLCEIPPISIGGANCTENNEQFTYEVSFSAISGATVTSSAGIVGNNIITNIPSGLNIIITIRVEGCEDTLVEVTAPNCTPLCPKPILSVGQIDCEEDAYSVKYISNGVVTTTAGTVDAVNNIITGIPLGTNVTITSTSADENCPSVTNLTVIGPSVCEPPCPTLVVGFGICDGGGTNTYTVSYTKDAESTLEVIGGVDNEDGTITGIIGTDMTVTAKNNNGVPCEISIYVESPESCNTCDLNLTIGGVNCELSTDSTYAVNFIATQGAVVSASVGQVSDGLVEGVPVGTDVILTLSLEGCGDVEVLVSADLWNDKDCDGDGVTNGQEIIDSTDPTYLCSYNPGSQDLSRTTTVWKETDCDGDGVINIDEVVGDMTDPLDLCDFVLESQTVTPSDEWEQTDCDGDGVDNGLEVEDATDPLIECDLIVDSQQFSSNPPSDEWNALDCDGDGVRNQQEQDDGTDVMIFCEFVQSNIDPDITTLEWRNFDCDGDGVLNINEVSKDNTDALDPCDFNPASREPGFDVVAFNKEFKCPGLNIIIHDIMSPNGDSKNEFFKIVNIEAFPDNNVEIYNRWGVLVYETRGYGGNNVFRGMSEGRQTIKEEDMLPVGTYFFIVNYINGEGLSIRQSGPLYITR